MFRRPRFGPCRACGYEPVERNASTCPNCGVRAPRRTPAQLALGIAISVVIVIFLIVVFVVFIVNVFDEPSLQALRVPSPTPAPD